MCHDAWRSRAATAAPLALAVALAGCGAGAAPTSRMPPSAPASTAAAAGAAPCQSAYYGPLQAAARAHLPVETTATAVSHWSGMAASTFQQVFGVAPTAAALEAALSAAGNGGATLTARSAGGGPAWTFSVDAGGAHLTVTNAPLSGAALAEAQSFGPAWSGGSAQYQVDFPGTGLSSAPTLSAYAQALAAAVAAGKADLTVATGGTLQPAPSAYTMYWGPLQLNNIVATGAACGAWKARTIALYSAADGAVRSVQAEMLDIGNGGSVGFAGGDFVTESAHAGVDTVEAFALPGLRPPAPA
jgi:hypothetical protein